MTNEQKEMALKLEGCTFLPGSPPKRFVRQMAANARSEKPTPLTEKQANWLKKLRHSYRRQIA